MEAVFRKGGLPTAPETISMLCSSYYVLPKNRGNPHLRAPRHVQKVVIPHPQLKNLQVKTGGRSPQGAEHLQGQIDQDWQQADFFP